MARSVRVELILDTLRGVKGAKDLSKAVGETADSLGDTAREGDKASRAIDDVGGQASQAARAAAGLDREIDKLNRSLREMAISQALTGESFSKQIRSQETEVRRLSRNRKLLGDFGSDAGEQAASGFATQFSSRVGPLITSGPGLVIAGAAIGAALAPTIAAGIAGGLTAGVGAAGIAGGIALVAKDPLVAASGKDLGTRFAAGVSAEAQSFRQPVLGALKDIDDAASRTVPKIGQIFRNTAPSVDALTGSLIRTGTALTDSLVAASGRSSGPLKAVGDLVENVGTEFSRMIDTLSQRSPEGVSAINDLSNAATNTVHAVTVALDGLARVKGGLDSFDHGVDSARFAIEDFFTKMAGGRTVFDITADGYTKGSAAAELYRKGVIGVNGSLNDYAHYQKQGATATQQASAATFQFIMDTFKADPPIKAMTVSLNRAEQAALGDRNALVALSNQLRAQADPAFALITAQNTLKTAQDRAAAATRNHGRNSVEARAATRELASAAIDLQGKVGALGSTFNGRLSPAMIASLRAAKLTDAQIAAVAREFVDAKKKGDAYAKRYAADARLTGGPAVSAKLKILGEMQAALAAGNKPASYYGSLNKALLGVGGPQINRAEGGPIPGWSPHKRADNIPAMLTAKEWVQPVDSVDYYGPGVMSAIQHRQIPADELKALASFAAGGQVWPYRVTAANTRIPSAKEIASKVIAAVPGAGGGPGYKWMEAVARAAFPGIGILSDYRPGARTLTGNTSYHALGRAVDFSPSLPFAEWVNAKYFARTKELITPWQNLNIRNGARHHYSALVENQHNFAGGNAHDHWAMANGGTIREPVFGYGMRTGASYSLAEHGPERVIPERNMTGGGGGTTVILNVYPSPLATPADTGRAVVGAIKAYDPNVLVSRWRSS